MPEKYSPFNESEIGRWDDFVESHPKGSPFHLSGWIRTIYETYAFEPLLYICKDGYGIHISDRIAGCDKSQGGTNYLIPFSNSQRQ